MGEKAGQRERYPTFLSVFHILVRRHQSQQVVESAECGFFAITHPHQHLNALLSVTSPAANRPGILVRLRESTLINPQGSMSTRPSANRDLGINCFFNKNRICRDFFLLAVVFDHYRAGRTIAFDLDEARMTLNLYIFSR